ncbi:DUF1488 family protein [Chelativorans xinjiangense]|uniref:DUF1488 family protein n=1 Tax=Chelativorans xinjiangense TaxID=2681485 RepID=UPI00135B7603|nr:DUF1488 family protein [Chelativorans xinjiangense]
MTLTFPNRSRSYDEAEQRVRFIGHDDMFGAARAMIHDVVREIYGSARGTVYVLTAADIQ